MLPAAGVRAGRRRGGRRARRRAALPGRAHRPPAGGAGAAGRLLVACPAGGAGLEPRQERGVTGGHAGVAAETTQALSWPPPAAVPEAGCGRLRTEQGGGVGGSRAPTCAIICSCSNCLVLSWSALCSFGLLRGTCCQHLHGSRRWWMRTRGTSPACSGAPWRTSWAAGGRQSWPRARRTAACASGALLRSRAHCTSSCIGPTFLGLCIYIQNCNLSLAGQDVSQGAHFWECSVTNAGNNAAARFAQCSKGVWDAPRPLLVLGNSQVGGKTHTWTAISSTVCARPFSCRLVCAVRSVDVKP